MAESTGAWSTPKVLLIALAITFGVMFVGNGICNEVLELGVPTWVFSGISGLAIFPVTLKWTVFRNIVARSARRQGNGRDA